MIIINTYSNYSHQYNKTLIHCKLVEKIFNSTVDINYYPQASPRGIVPASAWIKELFHSQPMNKCIIFTVVYHSVIPSFCQYVNMSETLTLLLTYKLWVLELCYFTRIFLVIHIVSLCWYMYIPFWHWH